jgi:hypothetical protein
MNLFFVVCVIDLFVFWSFCYVSLVFLLSYLVLFFEGACQSFFFFLLPQVNGHQCVNFGCTHPIDGLF